MLVVEAVDVRHTVGKSTGAAAVLPGEARTLVKVFRLLGFPVHVRPGFVVFMALIVFLYGNEFGLWLAGSLAVLTLIHELGHAVAARSTGAEAEISLDFLAGYASFTPSRPLTRWERAGISFAGPAIQILVASVVLVALGSSPLEPDSWGDSPAAAAIWWAGIAIGLLNLVPVLPLDGGHIVLTALDRLLPGRAVRPMLYYSIVATAAFAVLSFTNDRFRGFGILVAFLLISQLQMLGSARRAVSPWEAALAAAESGRERKATRILRASLSHPNQRAVPPSRPLTRDEAERLVSLLPHPFPRGNPSAEYGLALLLVQLGRFEDAANYAAESYAEHPTAPTAVIISRAAAALADVPTAVGWLQAARDSGGAESDLAAVIDRTHEFASIRQHPDVIRLRDTLAPSPMN